MADPNLEVHPNFASLAFCQVHEVLMDSLHIEVAQATQHLETAWDKDHHLCIDEWNAQCEAEAHEDACIQLEAQEREDEAHRLEEAEAKKEHCKAKKKKPKINDFDDDLPPPSSIIPRPSQYALQKLTTFDFVELWYFLPEGCLEASCNHRSQADNALRLSNSNDILTLCPVASIRALHNKRANHKLSFADFLQAKNSFLHHIKQADWPSRHINTLATFFWHLENHGVKINEHGDVTILHYTSRIHCHWHNELKRDAGGSFNISLINKNLLNSITFEINSNAQAKLSCKASST